MGAMAERVSGGPAPRERPGVPGTDGDPDDPFGTWCRPREDQGRRVSVLHLYGLVAARRGLQAHQLPLAERRALGARAMAVIWPGFETTPGSGRPDEPVEIVPPDPAWVERFQTWRARLAEHLGPVAERIDHIGSTAVPHLAAKPTIDVQVSVADLDDEGRYRSPLHAAGLQLRSRDAEHRYFPPPPERSREVHVHVCEAGSVWERRHLLFRDFLRTHPGARDAYAAVKRHAAEVWRDDRIGYTEAKSHLILDVLDRAEGWATACGWTVRWSGRTSRAGSGPAG